MLIEKAHLQNFTVFEDVKVEFVKGVNIMIGTNGTGKTHLLKSLYAVVESINDENKEDVKISRPYFSVDSLDLVRDNRKLNNRALVTAYFSETNSASYEITKSKGGEYAGELVIHSKTGFPGKSIFIPSKEMLSHSCSYLALYNEYKTPFDKTYVDILKNAQLPETKEITESNKTLLNTISQEIEGKVIHENGAFYIVKMDGMKIEFPIEAEGLRKFGLLWKLIRNGLLENGTILFWEEPEANINPELIPILVDVLLELQLKGVQIFIATHSYNLAKYFEIKRKETEQVLYHHLYKWNNGVKVESSPHLGELKNNPIIDADVELLDEVIEGNFNNE